MSAGTRRRSGREVRARMWVRMSCCHLLSWSISSARGDQSRRTGSSCPRFRLVGVFEIYELYLPVLNADGLGGQMLVEVVPRPPLLVDLAYASQGGHYLGGRPLVCALLRHLTPIVVASHQHRMPSRWTRGDPRVSTILRWPT